MPPLPSPPALPPSSAIKPHTAHFQPSVGGRGSLSAHSSHTRTLHSAPISSDPQTHLLILATMRLVCPPSLNPLPQRCKYGGLHHCLSPTCGEVHQFVIRHVYDLMPKFTFKTSRSLPDTRSRSKMVSRFYSQNVPMVLCMNILGFIERFRDLNIGT